jgi:polyhydroxyalkanoate synthesis regulator phasin
MAAKAHEISLEAGSKMAAAMKDVINAAAGLTGFVLESARDLVQFMVRRGQMTQEEADKLIREVEAAMPKQKKTAAAPPAKAPASAKPVHTPAHATTHTASHATSHASPAKAHAPAKPAAKKTAAKPAAKKAAAKKPAAKKAPAKKPAPAKAKKSGAKKGRR